MDSFYLYVFTFCHKLFLNCTMAFELLGIASMKVTRAMIGFFSPEAVSINAGVGPAGM